MVSACTFGALLWHPDSPVSRIGGGRRGAPEPDGPRHGAHLAGHHVFALGEAVGCAPEPRGHPDLPAAREGAALGRVLLRARPVRRRHRGRAGGSVSLLGAALRASLRPLRGHGSRRDGGRRGLRGRGGDRLRHDDHGPRRLQRPVGPLDGALRRGPRGGLHHLRGAPLGHEPEPRADAGVGPARHDLDGALALFHRAAPRDARGGAGLHRSCAVPGPSTARSSITRTSKRCIFCQGGLALGQA